MRWLLVAALLGAALGCGPSADAPQAAAPAAGSGGAPAPAFDLRDLAGGRVALADLRGRPVVIDFWATWCAPCERQVPVLNAFHDRHGDRVAVLGISVDAQEEAVAPFVADHGIAYRVLLGDEALAQRFGAIGFPSLFVVGPDGTIASAHVGVITEGELEEAVAPFEPGS